MFGGIAKWVFEIDRPERIPELVARAFATAVAGRPGPVVLALPEDVLAEMTDAPDAVPAPRVAAAPAAADLARMRELLAAAERPLAIVGGGGWTPQGAADVAAFLDGNGIPVAASFRCQDVVDNRLPVYCGDLGLGVNPALARRVREADVVLAIGTRLSETETGGYTYLTPPDPSQTLVHVHQDAAELGRVYRPEVGIVSGLPEFAAAARALEPFGGSRYAEWRAAARADYEATLSYEPAPGRRRRHGGRARAAARAAARCDRGQRGRATTRSGCTASGSSPATARSSRRSRARWAMACRRRSPASSCTPSARSSRLPGDGCFLMCAQELATMVANGLGVIVIVVNNGMLATIRMHQERHYPGRVMATDLVNPDFAAFARSFGVYGERVEETGGFAAALERALAAGGPALLELVCDPEALTPRQSLSEARAQGERSNAS